MEASAQSMAFKRAKLASNVAAADRRDDPAVAKAKREGGQELRRLLLSKFCEEGMTGAEVATICWHVTRAGGQGVADLGLQPSSATKHGHAHIMNHAGQIYPEVDLEYIDCPMHLKRESRRSYEKVPVYLPSSALGKFVTADMYDHPLEDFQMHVSEIASYEDHPVVVQARSENFRGLVRPLAIYWDGVAYTKNDSFTAFYCTDTLTGQKFLSFLVRSEEMCQCGCRGWCTLFPLLHRWAADLKKLEKGDLVRWAVLDVQGDWPAFLQVFGLRYWSHKTHPCPLCRIRNAEFNELIVNDLTLDELPFEPYTTNDYLRDLASAIKVITIPSASMRTKVYQVLGYRKKFRGRVVLQDIPELGLRKHSRLMPTATLPDVSKFEFLEPPFSTSWWVMSPETGRLLHDNPLMEVSGVTLEALSLDLMHTWHLGPVQILVSLALNFCLDTGFWAPSTNLDAAEKRRLGLYALKAELFQFYREQRADPDWNKRGSEEPRLHKPYKSIFSFLKTLRSGTLL